MEPMKWRLRQWARIPFPLALDDSRSVLAVKGSLRRFAPWTAPGRSEEMAVYEGKGGCRSASDFVSHLIAFDSIAPRPNPASAGARRGV